MPAKFGTDGIRGKANIDVTPNIAYKIGLAVSHSLSGGKKILIGRDPRISGTMLENAIASGICAGGSDAHIAGIVPTPAVAFLVLSEGFDAGIMISASHNPYYDNGIKIFSSDGMKLSDEIERKVENDISNADAIPLACDDKIGTVSHRPDLLRKYESHVSSIKLNGDFANIKRKVLIDCANGSASVTAESIFVSDEFFQFDTINDKPNGVNINLNCGSTKLGTLAEYVQSGGYDLGIAFDGDADRCLAVDEFGREIDGDRIITALAKEFKSRGTLTEDLVVVTKLSNIGLHMYLNSNGIGVLETDIGDRFVLERMVETGAILGGEQSGHIIVSTYATTGDGQVTAKLMLSLLKLNSGTASKVFGGMTVYPQIAVSVKIPNEDKNKAAEKLDKSREAHVIRDKLLGKGRLLIRASGTEPKVRIMLEGEDAEELKAYADELVQLTTNS
ncbi:phosphoglucosamine mutase [Clostridia bacterium]|nr:phosphoglucosamine mutase [Clostridia bacterium]